MSNPSAWVISQSIRKKTYQILSASTDDGIASVREYDRICKDLVPSDVAVDTASTDLSLVELYSNSEMERLELFYSTLGISDSDIIDITSYEKRGINILTSVIVYWIRNSQPQVHKM